MGSYWGKVARRAAHDAAVAVFTSRERAVISFLLQIAVGLLLYVALGEANVDPGVRIASAFAPLLLYPLAVAWKLVAVPANIYEEQRKEENQERVAQVWYLSQIYIMEVSPDNAEMISYGLTLPPEDWMNQKLEELGFHWRYRIKEGVKYVTEDVASV